MTDIKQKIPETEPKRKVRWMRGVRIAATSVCAFFAVIILLLTGATLYLTPDRLTRIVNEQASKILYADVNAHNVRFTLWSTFPHFCIEADSVEIVSRTLRSISAAQRKLIPANSDSLASAGFIRGGINLIKLIDGRIFLRDLEVHDLDINIVAINDSVNNYSIIPPDTATTEIPYFTANFIKLTDARKIRYFSAATGAKIDIDLSQADLNRITANNNAYRLKINGNMSADVKKLTLLRDFPFELDGRLNLHFNPFAINLANYTVNLGGMHGKMNLDMDLDDNPSISALNIRLNPLNLTRIAQYLPGIQAPYLSDIHADINIDASARLIAPYRFSSTSLPSLDVNFKVADGVLTYTINDRESYSMTHRGLAGHLYFDGENQKNTYFEIPPFSLTGEGISLRLNAKASDLMDSPLVTASLRADADLAKAGRIIRLLSPYNLKGRLNAETGVSVRIDGNQSHAILADMKAAGKIAISDAAFSDIIPSLNGKAGDIDISFNGTADALTASALKNGSLAVTAKGNGININYGDFRINSSSLLLLSSLSESTSVEFKDNSAIIPINLKLNALAVNAMNPLDTIRLSASGMSLDGSLTPSRGASHADNLKLHLKGRHVAYSQNDLSLALDNISSDFKAATVAHNPLPPVRRLPSEKWFADSAALKIREHTAPFLTARAPATLADLMARWRFNTRVRVARALLLADGFPMRNLLTDVDLEASFDSIVIHNLNAESGITAVRMNGCVGNLRRFLNSATPQPLPVRLDIAFDTIGINQLAHAYEAGIVKKKGAGAIVIHKPDSVSHTDTIAMLIPRNIIADIKASALETKYMDLRLRDLAADIRVADGNAVIDTLTISSDFGCAGLGLNFNTGSILDMGMAADVNVKEINVVNFFRNFHTLLLMMPQMKNLSGNISATCNGKFDIFPNMYVDVPSLFANIHVHGWGLTVHQNQFIRRITKMMFIHNSNDIHITDMNVHASVHDNLLELYPFRFAFDSYHINMGGVNNFDGRLYYHIGINDWPLKVPFGINIVGQFHDPDLRFGGPAYKDKKGSEITSSVMENNTFNLMMELKYYIREFIHKAAESDSTQNLTDITGPAS